MIVLAIDPGPERSAWVTWDGKSILEKGIYDNSTMLSIVRPTFLLQIAAICKIDVLVIEQIKSYGMAVSDTIFDTVFWTGRFCQAWEPGKWIRVPRMQVKMHFCHQAKARDANIRQALIDRFEPGLLPRKKPCGVLKGLHADLWAAFALGVYYLDNNGGEK